MKTPLYTALALTLFAMLSLGTPSSAEAKPRPNTSITDGPSGTVSATTATFSFSSTTPSATFECRLDSEAWRTCSSPRFYDRLAPGSHHFAVRARANGRADRTPATRSWLIAEPAPVAPEPQEPEPQEPAPQEPAPQEPAPQEPAPQEPAPDPAPSTSLSLLYTFDGSDGTFVSSSAFWNNSDDGLSENEHWFAESGTMYRRSGAGWTNSPTFRMWTRRTDQSFSQVEMDLRFNGWAGGTANWHGINLWLNRKLQSGSKINDGGQEGYVVDFLNRDGRLYLMKKASGSDTYHILDTLTWSPSVGTTYRWGGRVVRNGDSNTIQVLLNGQVIQQAVDNGSVGGAPLTGGRVGLRSDYADFKVDNLAITRP